MVERRELGRGRQALRRLIGIEPASSGGSRRAPCAPEYPMKGGAMGTIRNVLAVLGTAVAFAGCMHNAQAAGDVAIDPAVAANTTVLRVDNHYDAEVRVFSVMNGKENYLGTVAARRVREFALDPNLIGQPNVTFTSRQLDNSDAVSRGPFAMARGAVVDFVVPARDLGAVRPVPVPPAS
jgi:hypothetical protein